ncbi:retrovirus-related pol polyprotein from transposon TNT 1-94 [Tanacetum coccineum]|uniref:Retrovirus-related pol polyprotein from transposon TNT 1-94 n=1 Tax=Tanacetum coccineum TaxID=301880 RepID=A0ABQ5FGS2_9ASTR
MCSVCALGKSKKSSHQPKAEDTNQEKLYLLHMDLYGPMRVESINGKTYILVIVDDYSRFTWFNFLRSKDEAPDAIIKCIKNIQVRLNATARNVRTDNGTEFVNQILRDFYENVNISHQTCVARTPQQNGAEAINTGYYTQNRSLIHLRYNKIPYELMHDKKPYLSFFHVFGSLCYPTNDSEDLGKLNAKADIAMASEQFGSGPGLQVMTPATSSSGLIPNIIPQQPFPVAVALRAVEIADSHVSMFIDQDAPSSSIPLTQDQEHSLIISQDTPMVEKNNLDEDLQGTPVDATLYRGMIGSLISCGVLGHSTQYIRKRLILRCWSSKKQKSTAISSTEAEYIALSGCCAQILWMRS